MKGYYFITDAGLSRGGNLHDVTQAARAGAAAIQYRAKQASSRAMYEEAVILKKECGKVPFIVNDRLDIALAADADGIHVGQSDLPCLTVRRLIGPEKIIGVTVHTFEEAKTAERDGADYLGVSPIFATTTKPDALEPLGISFIAELRRRTRLPLVAIGGITRENVADVITAGADAVCAISAVVTHDDVFTTIRQFQELMRNATL